MRSNEGDSALGDEERDTEGRRFSREIWCRCRCGLKITRVVWGTRDGLLPYLVVFVWFVVR